MRVALFIHMYLTFDFIKVNRSFCFHQSKGQPKVSLFLFHFHFLFTFSFIMEMQVLGQQSSTSIGALILGRQWCTLRGWTLHSHVRTNVSVEKVIIEVLPYTKYTSLNMCHPGPLHLCIWTNSPVHPDPPSPWNHMPPRPCVCACLFWEGYLGMWPFLFGIFCIVFCVF